MSKRTQRISKRHALNDRELAFVRIYSAFGRANAAEAYRRAYLVEDGDDAWFEKNKKGEPLHDKPVDPRSASKRASALLAQDHISGYLDELDQGAGDHARQVLADAVLFTDDKVALNAAEKVLAGEDKLAFRDAVEKWAEILCAIDTEVVVPVPGGGEVVVPLKSMFPKYADALPPVEVLERTIRSLEQYRDARRAADASDQR